MGCLLDGSREKHLTPWAWKEKFSAGKETVPRAAPAHMRKPCRWCRPTAWELICRFWMDMPKERGSLTANWCGFDGSDNFQTIKHSTLITVDFPGHKFHGHTCNLQAIYWSFYCKVSSIQRLGKSHSKQLSPKCLVIFESGYQSFIFKVKFSPRKISHWCPPGCLENVSILIHNYISSILNTFLFYLPWTLTWPFSSPGAFTNVTE